MSGFATRLVCNGSLHRTFLLDNSTTKTNVSPYFLLTLPSDTSTNNDSRVQIVDCFLPSLLCSGVAVHEDGPLCTTKPVREIPMMFRVYRSVLCRIK